MLSFIPSQDNIYAKTAIKLDKTEFRELLREAGMTQVELAARLGLNPVTVSRWDIVPEYVVGYLSLYARVKGAISWPS